MTQSGGPAAINGFLYQIVSHLDWLTQVTLKGRIQNDDFEDGRLILEPRSGEDARAESERVFLVEQYKTRPDGTWSIAALEEVMLTLRGAVPANLPDRARYRFVTDGRPGRIESLKEFLVDVSTSTRPDELDSGTERDFGAGRYFTNRRYFDHLAQAGGLTLSTTEIDAKFHLLSRFEMEFQVDGSAKAAEIERLLRPCVRNLGDEISATQQLVGLIVEKLSKGEVRLDRVNICDLLRTAHVNPDRLSRLVGLPTRMSEFVKENLSSLGYQADMDVRSVPEWPADKPILLISGESGIGKTWQLGRLLERLIADGELVSLVRAGQSARDVVDAATRDLWMHGLEETTDKPLPAVLLLVREALKSYRSFVIARDDVKSVDLARDLVRHDLRRSGARLVLTVPAHVAQALEQTDSGIIHVHHTRQFSQDELGALLSRRNRRWVDLPEDLRNLLRLPLLAGAYLGLPYNSFTSAPNSEYEIFDRMWRRVAATGHSGDEGILLAIASQAYEGGNYPLPRGQWSNVGLSPEAADRLVSAGWMRASGGEAEFPHDRLLNWAAAKSLVVAFESGRLDAEALSQAIVNLAVPAVRARQRTLGYVPMDALWLLAADSNNVGLVSDIIAQKEKTGGIDELYGDLLPTLGARIVAPLRALLESEIREQANAFRVKSVGRAFSKLALQQGVDLAAEITFFLASPVSERQSVAIAALTVSPQALHLDRLWEIHRERTVALDSPRDGAQVNDYRESFEALRTSVRLQPSWLQQKIISTDPETEPVSELAYLLRSMEDPEASSIWGRVADVLIEKAENRRPRSVLACIARFRDRSRVDLVVRHLTTEEDLANSTALLALSIIDPERAIELLSSVRDFDRYASRNNWLPTLLRTHIESVQDGILSLARRSTQPRKTLEDLYWERPDGMSIATVEFFLDQIESSLREFTESEAREPHWLSHSLECIGRLTRPELISIIQRYSGSELERMIVAVARSRLATDSNWVDHILEAARRFLILVAGNGLTELLVSELSSPHYWVRHRALVAGFMRNDARIVDSLTAIARAPLVLSENGKPESQRLMEFSLSMTALAGLGADASLVELAMLHEGLQIPVGVASLRSHRGPVDRSATGRALQVIQDHSSPPGSIIGGLTVAWLSGDVDFIEPVREVLLRSSPDSNIARHAAIALTELGDTSEDFARRARALATTSSNQMWGRIALARLGDIGNRMLSELLSEEGGESNAQLDESIVRHLYSHEATRAQAIEAAVRLCNGRHSSILAPYDIAAEADDADIRERIVDKAFSGRSMFVGEPLKPIIGLARFDVGRAIEAIEFALNQHQAIEVDLCHLLVTISPSEAPGRLVAAACSLSRQSLSASVGKALRRSDPSVVARLLQERLQGGRNDRRTAAAVSGWLQIPELRATMAALLERETELDVREEVLAALERQDMEGNLRRQIEAFGSASYEQKWAILQPILNIGDAQLLRDREDPLWIGCVLAEPVPQVFLHYANFVLRNRKDRPK